MATTTAQTFLSALMQEYYDKKFLSMTKSQLVHEVGAQVRPLPKSSGKIVNFQKYTQLATITAALTEATNPTCVNLSATQVSVTVSEFGTYAKISKLLSLTAVDPNMSGKVEVMGQNAGRSRDYLVRAKSLTGLGTTQRAGGGAAASNVAATNTLSAAEIRKALRTLRGNEAMEYEDGYFLGKTNVHSEYDLMGDTTWVNAHTYKDGEALYAGEIGKLLGVRFLTAKANGYEAANTGTSNADLWSTYIHGKEAIGVTELSGDEKHIYVKTPDSHDTSNPLDRYDTVGWAMTFAPVRLNANWIIEIVCGATGQT